MMKAIESGWAVKLEDVSIHYKSGGFLKSRFEHKAIDKVSFRIRKGETFGIVGRNGCGKSSLLRVLAGIVQPTSGTIEYRKTKSKSLLSLGLGFDNQLTGTDNAILSLMLQGFSRKQSLEMLADIEEFSELGIFMNQPVRTYSAGMRSRLGFSVAIMAETDLLLIDETLSVGDVNFKQKAEKLMLNRINSNQTVVFVSHNGAQVRSLCHRAIWLEGGKIEAKGQPDKVVRKYNKFMNQVSNETDQKSKLEQL